MNKKIHAIIFVLFAAGLLLSACERSASFSPLITATTYGNVPFPVATQSQIMKDILAATQTAESELGTMTTGSLTGITTSTPAFTFFTDTPQGETSAGSLITPAITNTPVQSASTPLPPVATPMTMVYSTTTPGQPTQYASCSSIPGSGGSVPVITIIDVAQDLQVTIDATNFPSGQSLSVRMGSYGTDANSGTVVGSGNSGTSGCFSATYPIPSSLVGSAKIAIRVETTSGYYYGYNWFYNTNTR